MLLLLGACSIFLGPSANTSAADERGNCLDGEDNDSDGQTDCNDDDCDGARACTEVGDADTDTDTERCDVTVESTVPANNAVDAYYRAPLEFLLSGPDETARVETAIPGTLSHSPTGETLTFTPSGPLVPSTSYTARLHGCFGTEEVNFTTSDLGTPLSDPSVLEGRVYAIDLTEGRWTEPPGIGPLVASEVGHVGLLAVTGASSTHLAVLAAFASPDGAQDRTVNTASVDDLDFSADPWFQIEASDVIAPFAGAEATLEYARLEGAFAADGSHIGAVRVEGSVDTRSVAELLDPDDPGALCNTAASLGVACTDCRDGKEFCIPFAVDQMTSEALEDVEIVEITDGNALCATVSAGTPLAWWGLALLARRRRRNPAP